MLFLLVQLLIPLMVKAKGKSVQFPFTVGKKGTEFTEMIRAKLETEVCLGTPYQCNSFEFDLSTYLTYVLNASSPNVTYTNPFNSYTSSSFELLHNEELSFWRQGVKKGFIFKDKLKIGETELKATMVLASNVQILNCPGVIGLQQESPDTEVPSLLTLLIEANSINERIVSIEYSSPSSGFVTLGYSPSKATHLFKTPFTTEKLFPAYVVMGNKIQLTSEPKNPQIGSISIDSTFEYIEAPSRAKNDIYKAYHLDNEQCEERKHWFDKGIKTRSRRYFYYLCSRDFVEKNIGAYSNFTVQFNHKKKDLLVLNKEDLFSEYNSTHCMFNLVIKEGDTNSFDWVIGNVLLKKYRTVYNLEDSYISFYQLENSIKESGSMMLMGFGSIIAFSLLSLTIIFIRSRIIRGDKQRASLLSQSIDYTLSQPL